MEGGSIDTGGAQVGGEGGYMARVHHAVYLKILLLQIV